MFYETRIYKKGKSGKFRMIFRFKSDSKSPIRNLREYLYQNPDKKGEFYALTFDVDNPDDVAVSDILKV